MRCQVNAVVSGPLVLAATNTAHVSADDQFVTNAQRSRRTPRVDRGRPRIAYSDVISIERCLSSHASVRLCVIARRVRTLQECRLKSPLN